MWNDVLAGPSRRRWPVALALVAVVAVGGPLCPGSSRADEDRSRLDRMLEAADDGEWDWAARLAANSGVPALRSYVRWRQLLEAKDSPPFADYAAFLRASSDWPSLGTLQARAEDALDEFVPVEDRLAFFAGREPRTRQGRVLYAQALLAAGRGGEATALLREAWVEDDFAADEEASFLDRYGTALTPESHAARLNRLLWDERIDQARRMLPRVGRDDRAVATARLKLQLSAPGRRGGPGVAPASAPARRGRDVRPAALAARSGQRGRRTRDPAQSAGGACAGPELWWPEQEKAIRDAVAEHEFKLAYRLAGASRQSSGARYADAEWLAGWLALQFTASPRPRGATSSVSGRRSRRRSAEAVRATGPDAPPRRTATRRPRRLVQPSCHQSEQLLWSARRRRARARGRSPLACGEAASDAARAALRRRLPATLGELFCRAGQPRYAQPFFRHLGYEAASNADQLAAVWHWREACGHAELVLAATRGAAGNGAYLRAGVLSAAARRRVRAGP